MKVRKISGGIFMFGIAYALTTLGRGAPMLISALSLVALSRDPFSGGLALTIYSFCLGIPLVLFAVTMEILRPERMEGVIRRSAMLEKITGVLLLALGAYYNISAIY
ncbi:MAG: cytochrome c biogenesis protein CcdA [Candidatus Methanomethylicaceae archaeon]